MSDYKIGYISYTNGINLYVQIKEGKDKQKDTFNPFVENQTLGKRACFLPYENLIDIVYGNLLCISCFHVVNLPVKKPFKPNAIIKGTLC